MFFSHLLTLILVLLVPIALCITSVKASLMILIFVFSMADIMSYSTLHGSPAPSTELEKLNGWVDGMDGIGASPGSACVLGYIK